LFCALAASFKLGARHERQAPPPSESKGDETSATKYDAPVFPNALGC